MREVFGNRRQVKTENFVAFQRIFFDILNSLLYSSHVFNEKFVIFSVFLRDFVHYKYLYSSFLEGDFMTAEKESLILLKFCVLQEFNKNTCLAHQNNYREKCKTYK